MVFEFDQSTVTILNARLENITAANIAIQSFATTVDRVGNASSENRTPARLKRRRSSATEAMTVSSPKRANDAVFGHEGNDELHGGDGNDYVSGSYGRDSSTANAGNDNLLAGATVTSLWRQPATTPSPAAPATTPSSVTAATTT